MDRYHIIGGKRLSGTLTAAGAKNAALPILAATLLSTGVCRICNCPDLSDVRIMMEILRSLGCEVRREGESVVVDAGTVCSSVIPDHLMKGMRSSVFLMGPMLARLGQVTFSQPGGCAIGSRPIDIHLKALRSLGAKVEVQDERLICQAEQLAGAELTLEVPSVGATENAMLAAVGARGDTVIYGAAKEPEIVDLQDFINACGGYITGAGTAEIHIRGTGLLHGAEHQVIPDRIEAGTLLCAAAVTGGEVCLRNARADHMSAVLDLLKDAGCRIKTSPEAIWLEAPETLLAARQIRTEPYPGFPTDMQSQLMTLMSVAQGTTEITETIFENRFKTALELKRMGARIAVTGRSARIDGVKRLRGAELSAMDLRGGAALVLAGLCAEGGSIVENICHIDRGYDKFEVELRKMGAHIRREHLE